MKPQHAQNSTGHHIMFRRFGLMGPPGRPARSSVGSCALLLAEGPLSDSCLCMQVLSELMPQDEVLSGIRNACLLVDPSCGTANYCAAIAGGPLLAAEHFFRPDLQEVDSDALHAAAQTVCIRCTRVVVDEFRYT